MRSPEGLADLSEAMLCNEPGKRRVVCAVETIPQIRKRGTYYHDLIRASTIVPSPYNTVPHLQRKLLSVHCHTDGNIQVVTGAARPRPYPMSPPLQRPTIVLSEILSYSN